MECRVVGNYWYSSGQYTDIRSPTLGWMLSLLVQFRNQRVLCMTHDQFPKLIRYSFEFHYRALMPGEFDLVNEFLDPVCKIIFVLCLSDVFPGSTNSFSCSCRYSYWASIGIDLKHLVSRWPTSPNLLSRLDKNLDEVTRFRIWSAVYIWAHLKRAFANGGKLIVSLCSASSTGTGFWLSNGGFKIPFAILSADWLSEPFISFDMCF